METIEEMRARASSMPYGVERLDLRRKIWRLRKAQLAEKRKERRRPSPDGLVIGTSSPVARKDYECYGCLGECPIPKGDAYFAVKVINGGRIVMVRYCQRCHAAITNKVALWGRLEVHGPGQFRWTKLSKSFRERWKKLIAEIVELKRNGKPQIEAIKKFMDENQKYEGVGIHGKSGGGRTSPSSSGSFHQGAVQQKD